VELAPQGAARERTIVDVDVERSRVAENCISHERSNHDTTGRGSGVARGGSHEADNDAAVDPRHAPVDMRRGRVGDTMHGDAEAKPQSRRRVREDDRRRSVAAEGPLTAERRRCAIAFVAAVQRGKQGSTLSKCAARQERHPGQSYQTPHEFLQYCHHIPPESCPD